MNFSQRVAHSTKKDPNQYFSIIKTDPFRARLNTWLAHSKTRFTAFCLANRRSSKSLNILEFQRKPVKKRTSGIDRKSSKMELMGGVELCLKSENTDISRKGETSLNGVSKSVSKIKEQSHVCECLVP